MLPFFMSPFLSPYSFSRHGFFGRNGGVSTGEFSSLNCGRFKGDADEAVFENRRRVVDALGVSDAKLLFLDQKHTSDVVVLDKPFDDHLNGNIPIADAIVTGLFNQPIGVQTADCVPVLFLDPKTRLIGAAHAGWKGLSEGILQNTI
jgi:copper oxidase (laccase) domain-containing protein